MTEPVTNVEASNPTLGSFKVSGANLNTLFTVLSFVALIVGGWILWMHTTETMAGGKEVAKELKEANKEVASALKESNREVSKVLNELARAMREQNCLQSFPTPQMKAQNADLCKRISQ